jgi:predicted RNase H-like HicB family nuclease
MNNINLTAVFEPCEEGGFLAYIDEIKGINTQGETIEEAKENLADAINLVFEEIRAERSLGKAKNSIKQNITFTL